MSIFSFFVKKEKQLKCDWCGKEIEEAPYTKYINNKKFNFCSESCKRCFRKSGKGKASYRGCASCPMSPKSWD